MFICPLCARFDRLYKATLTKRMGTAAPNLAGERAATAGVGCNLSAVTLPVMQADICFQGISGILELSENELFEGKGFVTGGSASDGTGPGCNAARECKAGLPLARR